MTEPTPADQVELFTSIMSGIDHLIHLLREEPYDCVRQMAADSLACFMVLEQEKDDVPDEVLEAQEKMARGQLDLARSKMHRDWHTLDMMVFGLEVGETTLRIYTQARDKDLPARLVALSILAMMFRKPEAYVETLRIRNPPI